MEDIAKKQKADPKVLWAKVKPQIRVSLMDMDLPDPLPTYCSFNIGSADGSVYTRCRAACILGHTTCPQHSGKPIVQPKTSLPQVHRILDYNNQQYFVDDMNIVYDKTGTPVGTVQEDTLMLFEGT